MTLTRVLFLGGFAAASLSLHGQVSSFTFSGEAVDFNSSEATSTAFSGEITFNNLSGDLDILFRNDTAPAVLTFLGFNLASGIDVDSFDSVTPVQINPGDPIDTNLDFKLKADFHLKGATQTGVQFGTFDYAVKAKNPKPSKGLGIQDDDPNPLPGTAALFEFTLSGDYDGKSAFDLFADNPSGQFDFFTRYQSLDNGGSDKIAIAYAFNESVSTVAVPEPALYGLGGVFLIAGVMLRRKIRC